MAENYRVLPSYKRFNQKNNSIMRSEWDPSLNFFGERYYGAIRSHIEKGDKGFDHLDFAFWGGSSTVTSSLGTNINAPNSGLTSWEPLKSKWYVPPEAGKYRVEEPARMRETVAKVARYYGADLVGFTELDERWVYSHHYIAAEGLNPPVEIPEGCGEVIVLGLELDYEMMKTAPTAIMKTETYWNYSRMSMLVSSLAKFIRGLGYRAIPCLNDTALSVPLAIDAGLGQPSRLGLVITPKYGPRLRWCKVITDLPLGGKKKHLDFGVIEFCEACEKCAEACPAGAIPRGPRTTEGHNISNNPGVLKWYLNYEKCRTYWSQVGTNCGICMRACPFNKGRGFQHDIVRWFIKSFPFLDSTIVRFDDWLGYGKQKDPCFFWDERA